MGAADGLQLLRLLRAGSARRGDQVQKRVFDYILDPGKDFQGHIPLLESDSDEWMHEWMSEPLVETCTDRNCN